MYHFRLHLRHRDISLLLIAILFNYLSLNRCRGIGKHGNELPQPRGQVIR